MSAPDPLVAELRTLRLMLGVRATDIADATGLNLASISNWENGRTLPRVEKLRPYAAAIGFELTLTPTDETAARLPLLDLTADEIRAIAVQLAGWLQLGDDPLIRSALTKLCRHEQHGGDGGACPGCGWDSHPIPPTPARPHHDEPPLDRPVVDVHLPAADIA